MATSKAFLENSFFITGFEDLSEDKGSCSMSPHDQRNDEIAAGTFGQFLCHYLKTQSV